MSKSEYIKSLSGVHPSEEVVERIMDMTNSKKKKGIKKGILGIIVTAALLVGGAFSANAATDGAVAQAIDTGISTLKVYVNGKAVESNDIIANENTIENGDTTIKEYDLVLPDGSKASYSIEYYDDGVEWSKTNDELTIETDDFKEPTTVVNNE